MTSPRTVDYSAATVANDLRTGAVAGAFPQPDDKVRAYFCYNRESFDRLQGEPDFHRAFGSCSRLRHGSELDSLRDAKPCGPLASFECADVWVEHPYANGIALLGDAAASSGPSVGSGLVARIPGCAGAFRGTACRPGLERGGSPLCRASGCRLWRSSVKVTGWAWQMFQQTGPDGRLPQGRVPSL